MECVGTAETVRTGVPVWRGVSRSHNERSPAEFILHDVPLFFRVIQTPKHIRTSRSARCEHWNALHAPLHCALAIVLCMWFASFLLRMAPIAHALAN